MVLLNEIFCHMLATILETDQLSLFIEAIMIVLPFNEGIDASQFFSFDFQNSISNLIFQISS